LLRCYRAAAAAAAAPPFVGWLLRCYRAAATASLPTGAAVAADDDDADGNADDIC
jgi:hypothetical protein